MADHSKIEWTDATWNPTVGCSKVSEGCKFCYAIRDAHRMSSNPNPKIAAAYAGLTMIQNGRPNWTGVVRLLPDRLEIPLHWKKPRRVFVNSQSDLFHEALTDDDIARVFAVMAKARQHQFQVLTKRPERLRAWMEHHRSQSSPSVFRMDIPRAWGSSLWGTYFLPLPNVWLGTSVEDQATADRRLPELIATPAAVRFVSAEPLLGPVDISKALGPWTATNVGTYSCPNIEMWGGIGWVIVGGESGPGARPMYPRWARSLRDQCRATQVPFFFKQWGEWGPPAAGMTPLPPQAVHMFSESGPGDGGILYLYRFGKKLAGRLLDGQEWNEYPEGAP